MLQAQRHRGPDDTGTFVEAHAQLAQVRLSIIDLAGGQQPIPNEDETAWVICNGEIYNYHELRAELEADGHRFRTHSDTEVVLHLYEKYGENCVAHLRGMFAFAIWDCRQQRLFAARDHLGQKPFYYAHLGDELFFASEIKGILAARPDLREVDREALDQYLALRLIAAPRSMFTRVRKLPPAHWLSYSPADGLKTARYWVLDYEPKLDISGERLLEELEQRILESLRLHMIADVPVGAFLSGGMDSSLIVAMLSKHVVGAHLPTFTLSLPHKEFDEAPAARAVARHFATDHHEEVLDPSLAALLPELVWHLDEPSDPLSLCAYMVAGIARRHVKVVLGGDGGDELFGGYDRYYGYKLAGAYARVPAIFRRGLISPLIQSRSQGNWYKSRVHQLQWLDRLAEQTGSSRYAMALNYFYFDHATRARLYGDTMQQEFGRLDPTMAIRAPFDNCHAQDPIDRMICADSQVRLPDHPVMITDRMTMAHGLEARSPFMDHKLAEFAARLPVHTKVKGRRLRCLEKQLAARYLPPEILARPKQGFASALPYMLRDEYPVIFRALLSDARMVADGYFRAGEIEQLLRDHLTGRVDHATRLWLLANSEIWYRMHIKGQSRDELAAIVAPGLQRQGIRQYAAAG
jgi:asparagine synthase (glutamine-hydrolysing)